MSLHPASSAQSADNPTQHAFTEARRDQAVKLVRRHSQRCPRLRPATLLLQSCRLLEPGLHGLPLPSLLSRCLLALHGLLSRCLLALVGFLPLQPQHAAQGQPG